LTLNNLSRDIQGVEKVDLRWVKASWACRACEVNWGDDSYSSFSWNFICFNFKSELMDGSISEDECYLILEERLKDLKLGNFSSKLLFKMLELFSFNSLNSHLDDFLDEGLSIFLCTFLEMTS
jgi:hypothetical protein